MESIVVFTIFLVNILYFCYTIVGDDIMNKPELPACPVEITLSLMADKWKFLIIRDLPTGTKRFGELQKSIGRVSQKVLTNNLRQMEKSGLITRKVYAEVPPKVEYSLTDLGRSLKPILDSMVNWGEDYRKMFSGTPS